MSSPVGRSSVMDSLPGGQYSGELMFCLYIKPDKLGKGSVNDQIAQTSNTATMAAANRDLSLEEDDGCLARNTLWAMARVNEKERQ
ncbi:hypothetical protein HAX54_011307 [Datura stramonium]|uniref:Uncharacterized protein n=1 Tax=Datura stramonium TaxID=4076 RepID=A0ABS8THP9_DATST|nr:hypothetical protein [Datura stramonium]